MTVFLCNYFIKNYFIKKKMCDYKFSLHEIKFEFPLIDEIVRQLCKSLLKGF